MSRDESSLIDVINAGKRILDYVAGLGRDAVEQNSMIRSAILYEFLVMGEAVKRLTPEFREPARCFVGPDRRYEGRAHPWLRPHRFRPRLVGHRACSPRPPRHSNAAGTHGPYRVTAACKRNAMT